MDRREDGRHVLNSLLERSKQEYVPPMAFADLHFALQENKQGFDWLERAYELRDPGLTWLKVFPIYDSVRSDPRYTALLRKMNLED